MTSPDMKKTETEASDGYRVDISESLGDDGKPQVLTVTASGPSWEFTYEGSSASALAVLHALVELAARVLPASVQRGAARTFQSFVERASKPAAPASSTDTPASSTPTGGAGTVPVGTPLI